MADDDQPTDEKSPDLSALAQFGADAMLAALGDKKKTGGLIKTLSAIVLGVVRVVFTSLLDVATWVVSAIQQILEQGNAGIGKLSATIVATLFGHEVSDAMLAGFGGQGDLAGVGQHVGHAMLSAIFGDLAELKPEPLMPGTARAEGYLGAITEMVTRGFLLSTITETLSLGQLHLVHELEEELISGLGLGRIARRVLQPFVSTLVSEPAQWAINIAYRPKLHSVGDAIRLWEVGDLDDATLDDELGRQGWSAEKIEHAKTLHLKPLDFDSAMTLATHGVLTEDDVVSVLQHDGYGDAAARHKVAAWHLKRVDSWTDKYIALLVSQFEQGRISQAVFQSSLSKTGRPGDELQAVAVLAGADIEVPRKVLSEGQLMAAWDNNTLTQDDVAAGLKKLGYGAEDITTLLLTKLAVGQHKHDIDLMKAKQAADRAAQRAADKLATQTARADAQRARAAEQLAKAETAAAEKAQASADAEARRQLIVQQAEQRRALVDAAHQAASIDADHAAALKAQIDASEKALLASATAQEAEATITFERALLDLKKSLRESALDAALADVDLAAETDAAARQQGVTIRADTVDAILKLQLDDVDTLYTARAVNIDDDLAASLTAVDVAQLPTIDERQQVAAGKILELDAELSRKLADLGDEYAERHSIVDDERQRGILTDKAAAREHDRLTTGQHQAERLATQQHDLGALRLQDAATSSTAIAAITASNDKLKLTTNAAKARRQLAADKMAAQLSAQHSADAEKLRLQAIQAQQGAISAGEVLKRKKSLTDHDAKSQAQETLQATSIDHAEHNAQVNAAKAQTAVEAAQQRLSLLERTASAREAAAADATAKLQAFDADAERQREQLEATIMGHRIGPRAAPPKKIQK